MHTKRLLAFFLLTAVALIAVGGTALASKERSDIKQAKAATAPFHNVANAEAAGYGRFLDAAGIACIAHDSMGAMGIHYVNGDLVGDAVLDPARPEAVVYAPGKHGKLKLAALEYIVFKDVWEAAGHLQPPTLFGQEFNFTDSPNRYGIPPFYALHAWIWKKNPSGQFAPYNPRVHC